MNEAARIAPRMEPGIELDEPARWSAPLRLARRIAREIIASDMAVGARLGALPDIAERFGVSVATLRKALTFLLDDGLVRLREGRGGGLVVGSPPAASALRGMFLYLSDLAISPAQVAEARILIDGAVIERAARLVGEDDHARWRDAAALACPAAAIAALEEAVLAAARQPILTLFSRLLASFAGERSTLTAADLAAERAVREAAMGAILGGNMPEALGCWAARRTMVAAPVAAEEASSRLADDVANGIRRMIREQGLGAGDELGREADLQERFGTSPATVRDALRLLERGGIARVSQGRNGGVFVGDAQPYGAIEMTTLYLSATRLDFATQIEARRVVEARAAQLAAERIGPDLARQLEQAMAEDARAARARLDLWPERGAAVERLIARACANPVIEFFTLVLIDLSMSRETHASIAQNDLARLVSLHHTEIGADILAHRPIDAAFHTRAYLTDLARWVELRSLPLPAFTGAR